MKGPPLVEEELLLRITTCLAQNGYFEEVGIMVQLNKTFWGDEQIWDAFKDVPGPGGRTRLMYCSHRGSLERATFYLQRGARVNKPCRDGGTALIWAAQAGHVDLGILLLDHKAKVDQSTSNQTTALMVACEFGHLDMVRLLINRGSNPNASTVEGVTSLMLASQWRHLSVERFLVGEGKADVDAVTNTGEVAHLTPWL